MEEHRWLLPFTEGIDVRAILAVLRLAHDSCATLVPVSLIPVQPSRGSGSIRLGRIEQSKDFLESVRWRAEQFHVAVECHEITTTDVQNSIRMIAHEWCCTSMVVVSSTSAVFLDFRELRDLLVHPPVSLILVRLPARRSVEIGALIERLLPWMSKKRGNERQQSDMVQEEPICEPESSYLHTTHR